MWLHELATERELLYLAEERGDIIGAEFSLDGRWLALLEADDAEANGTARLRVWDAHTGQERITVPSAIQYGLTRHTDLLGLAGAFSPDGRLLVQVLPGETGLVLWDLEAKQRRQVLSGARPPLMFAPDGRTLAAARAEGRVELWDVATGQRRHVLVGHPSRVGAVVFSPDGRRLVTGLTWRNAAEVDHDKLISNSELKLWDVATGAEQATLPLRTTSGADLVFNRDGRFLLVSRSFDSELWDLATAPPPALQELIERTATMDAEGNREFVWSAPTFSPDGTRLLQVGEEPGTLALSEIGTGRKTILRLYHGGECISQALFSPDGRTVAAGVTYPAPEYAPLYNGPLGDWIRVPRGTSPNNGVQLFDVASGKSLKVLLRHGDSIGFSPYSQFFYTTNIVNWRDTVISVWTVAPEWPVALWVSGAAAVLLIVLLAKWWFEARQRRIQT